MEGTHCTEVVAPCCSKDRTRTSRSIPVDTVLSVGNIPSWEGHLFGNPVAAFLFCRLGSLLSPRICQCFLQKDPDIYLGDVQVYHTWSRDEWLLVALG